MKANKIELSVYTGVMNNILIMIPIFAKSVKITTAASL